LALARNLFITIGECNMNRRTIPLLVALAIIASMSLISVSARSTPGKTAGSAGQATPACADKTFMETLGKDLTELGNLLKGFKMDDTASIAQTSIQIISARQKYEDMTDVPSECVTTQLAVIIAYANAGDMLSLAMAIKGDPTNAAEYAKALTGQGERVSKSVNQVLIQAGLATPAP
jgi:hypothetical protein